MADDWNEEKIREFLSEQFTVHGKTTSIAVCREKAHQRFYAFVAYEKEEDAQKAYNENNNETLPGSENKLYVNFAKSKRQFKLEQMQKFVQQPTNLYIKW